VSGLGPAAGVVASAVVAATALTGAAATGSLGSGRAPVGSGFTLRGHVGGLYPGASKRLVVAVHNRSRRPLRIRSITTRVRAARRGCGARNVRVSSFRGRVRVGAGRTRRVAVRVRMLSTSPPACQGAVFPLVFRGRATAR
jgi:hypothetical protein